MHAVNSSKGSDPECFKISTALYAGPLRRFCKPSFKDRSQRSELCGRQRNFTSPNEYLIGLLLLCGDVATQPGPRMNSINCANSSYKCMVLNARGLKSWNKVQDANLQTELVYNLHRFQNLVCSEDADIVCVNENGLTRP